MPLKFGQLAQKVELSASFRTLWPLGNGRLGWRHKKATTPAANTYIPRFRGPYYI